VNITCSALPEQLLESELFGHERGAFTDARQQKRGLFETGDGGTVFLDEIGEITAGLQSKLLRFLEEKTFKRVGGLADVRVDVRVIAATNRDLEQEVKTGKFREDLFYRLHVMPLVLPPLRDRDGDIRLLIDYYIDRFNREFRKKVRGLNAAALALPRTLLVAWKHPRAPQRDRTRHAARRSRVADAARFSVVDEAVIVRMDVSASARKASTSKMSSVSWSYKRSSGVPGTRRTRAICCGSIAIKFAIESKSLDLRSPTERTALLVLGEESCGGVSWRYVVWSGGFVGPQR
jgi:sigma54-dependent transcription regulator